MQLKVLDFTAKWCSTCIALDRLLQSAVIPKYKNRVQFVKVDVEEKEDLTKKFDILSVPTLILLKEGKQIWRKSGSAASEITKELSRAVK